MLSLFNRLKPDRYDFLIAGLGNPGILYEHSRHNAGFLTLDAFASAHSSTIQKRFRRNLVGEACLNDKRILLIKPQTFMNLSGEAVRDALTFYMIHTKRLIVVYDDIDLPTGDIRIREKGSAGTHNGMRSIIACLDGFEDFARVRIGVGNERNEKELAAHVLESPTKAEQSIIEDAIVHAVEALALIVDGKLGIAQSRYNRKAR